MLFSLRFIEAGLMKRQEFLFLTPWILALTEVILVITCEIRCNQSAEEEAGEIWECFAPAHHLFLCSSPAAQLKTFPS